MDKKTEFRLPTGVLSASIGPEPSTVIAATMDGVYRAADDGKDITRLYQHETYVSSVEVLGSGLILSAGYDGQVCWFDLQRREMVRQKKVHGFWSWDMAVAPDASVLATVTGQYLAGGYKYEPQAEREPSIKVLSVETGEVLREFPHVPPVQSVAVSGDNRYVAAGNLMGEVRVYDLQSGDLAASFTTPDFTSWGIIKSHCYLGGIFALKFLPNHDLILAGMGPMRDPMAGNGKQRWQRWRWTGDAAEKVGEINAGDAGEGLMEALAVDPSGERFVMAGRLRGGEWNLAIFRTETGEMLHKEKLGYRVTDARFLNDGKRLMVVGAQGQPNKVKDGKFNDFGRVQIFDTDVA